MTILENIQKKINDAENRLAEVKQELTKLKTLLEEKRKEQGAAIVSDKDAEKLGKEFMALQTQISGAEEAGAQLLETLRDLRDQKTRELRSINRGMSEEDKSEIMLIETDIYALIAQAANRLPDLSKKRFEYISHLQAAGSQNVRDEVRNILFLLELLQKELPKLLDIFPIQILVRGDLPSPQTIRSKLKEV